MTTPSAQRYIIIGGKLVPFRLAANGSRMLPTATFDEFHGNRINAFTAHVEQVKASNKEESHEHYT